MRLVHTKVSAYRVVFALIDCDRVRCAKCLEPDWTIPVDGYADSKHEYGINVCKIDNGEENWTVRTHSVPVRVYSIRSMTLRGLGREARSFALFDSGREMVCSCGRRIFRAEKVEASAMVEYVAAKIF